MDQAKLLQSAQDGDPAAFHELVRPHLDSLRRFSRGSARNWQDADDIAQEALIKAFRSLDQYRGDSALSTWLYRITRNTAIDWYRSRLGKASERESEVQDEVTPDRSEQADQLGLLQQRDRASALWGGIRELEAQFRIPLVLAEIEGKTYAEIAHIEGVPVGTIRSRISRAKKHLAALLRRRDEFARNTPLPPLPAKLSAASHLPAGSARPDHGGNQGTLLAFSPSKRESA